MLSTPQLIPQALGPAFCLHAQPALALETQRAGTASEALA